MKHGLRNSTLTALMPSETSSQISNATNGIEPPRGYVSVKASKDGILKQVVPEFTNTKITTSYFGILVVTMVTCT
ncbi:ribonucleotide reductase of class Ia aerobic alpha subunit [Vibrio astriarenae]|nr:ribonucleotide reductase of class Ia aerobic alpha subunit [Vibrio sp. C7]